MLENADTARRRGACARDAMASRCGVSGAVRYRGLSMSVWVRRRVGGLCLAYGLSAGNAAGLRAAGRVPVMPGLRAVTRDLFRVTVVETPVTRNK